MGRVHGTGTVMGSSSLKFPKSWTMRAALRLTWLTAGNYGLAWATIILRPERSEEAVHLVTAWTAALGVLGAVVGVYGLRSVDLPGSPGIIRPTTSNEP